MRFYTNNTVPRDKVFVELKENIHNGEVGILLNGIEHLVLSVDGDVVRCFVEDKDKITGIEYIKNEIKVWRED